VAALLVGGAAAADQVVRFPAQRLADGTVIPEHRAFAADGSDAAAAARRQELLRAPYLGAAREVEIRGGEIVLRADASLDASLPALAAALEKGAAQLFDRDGFARPFSRGGGVQVLVSGGRDGVSASAWSGREKGAGPLVDPLVSVTGGARQADVVALDAVHGLAALTLRRSAPNAPPWVVEALAESLARRALGWRGEPVGDGADPLRADAGDAREPVALAALFDRLIERLPGGAADVRTLWEDSRAGGADAEELLRELGARADARGFAGLLADAVAARLETAPAPRAAARRAGGDLTIPAPGAFGWRRVALSTAGDRGGLELVLPDSPAGAAVARAVVFYRGEDGGFDAAALEPGAARRFPLAGTSELDVLLVDGDGRDVPIRARRIADYPAALAAAAAEREAGGVRVSWRTSSHRDLLAWVLVRYEETDDGALRETARELVPTSEAASSDYDYVILDRGAAPERRSLYRVYALTTGGFLSETFETTVSPGD